MSDRKKTNFFASLSSIKVDISLDCPPELNNLDNVDPITLERNNLAIDLANHLLITLDAVDINHYGEIIITFMYQKELAGLSKWISHMKQRVLDEAIKWTKENRPDII